MYLLTAVIENEDLLDEVITGWLDMGISGATVIESTGALQLISQHVPIFAGLRSLTSGGSRHSKTIFTIVQSRQTLDMAIGYLKNLCEKRDYLHHGIYFAIPVTDFGHLNREPAE